MPNLVKEFRVKVGFLWGGGGGAKPPRTTRTKNYPLKIWLTVFHMGGGGKDSATKFLGRHNSCFDSSSSTKFGIFS